VIGLRQRVRAGMEVVGATAERRQIEHEQLDQRIRGELLNL
jgi:hypothetical protein